MKLHPSLGEALLKADLNRSISDFRTKSSDFFAYTSRDQNKLLQEVSRYKAELELVKSQIQFYRDQAAVTLGGIYYFDQWSEREVSGLKRQQGLLQQVVDTGVELLAIGDNLLLEYRFRTLEAELNWARIMVVGPYGLEHISVSDAKDDLRSAIKARQREHLKMLRRCVRKLIRKLLRAVALDRRAKFRSIVHFIFKNMDDYDGENYVLQAA